MRAALAVLAISTYAQDPAALYKQYCAVCHDTPTGRVPPSAALQAMSPDAIRAALSTGIMRQQGAALTEAERNALAKHLGAAPSATTKSNACPANLTPIATPNWSSWSPQPTNARYQPNPGLTAADVPKLKLKWAYNLGEGTQARSQPAVLNGRLYIGTAAGSILAIDASTGCTHWTYKAAAPIRSGIVATDAAIYAGDTKANLYALNPTTGQPLWQRKMDPHPAASLTGTPTLHEGTLYVPVASLEEVVGNNPKYECCTFRGSLAALDAKTGAIKWQTHTIPDPSRPTTKNSIGTQRHGPSGASVWSAPTIDDKHDIVYIATGDNYSEPASKTSDAVMALNRKTGQILWTRQLTSGDVFVVSCTNCGPDFDFGQSPILVNLPANKRALVIGQKSGVVHALDPDAEGQIRWQTRLSPGGKLGGLQWGSASDGTNLYAAVSDIAFEGRALSPTKGGGLHALQLTTGEKIWSAQPTPCPPNKPACSPAQSAAVTAMPGVVFSGSLDGHLRAYSTTDGKVIWDFDTARPHPAVNADTARGGAIDVAGPVLAGGMLFTNSGYGAFGGQPGNALLAFSVDGQ
jgi:polyvinyl alcohol dehydrogenase (cytochrome)